ncbi:unnamed protein product [Closterium sp. NIES-64]|nr:unnamed protein product [Closterium sp. NIES-64]
MLPHAAFPHRPGATAPSKSALLVNPQGSKVPTTQGSPCFLPRYPLRIISASRTLSAVPTLSAFPAFSASRSPFSYSCTPAFPLKLRRSHPLRHLSHWRTPHLPAPARASDSGGRTGGGADAGGDGAESGDGGARAGGVTADAAAGDNGGFWATVSSAMQSMADVVTQAQRELLEGEYSAGTPWLDDDDVSLLHSQITPYNFIKVVEVSRRADNSLAGSRVLLLDQPGNIHSMHFKYKPWTGSYYDLFTLLPPLLPSSSGPIAILGLAAGTGARLLLRHYPHLELHGWEIDEHVIQVARTYFDLEELEDGSFAAQELRPYVPFSDSDTDSNEGDYMGEEEEKEQDHGTRAAAAAAAAVTVIGTATEADLSHADGIGRLVAHCGDALSSSATVPGGFAGIIVDLYSRGAVVAPLQREDTWRDLSGRLREGGKILVNCGGGCVEGDESVQSDGEAIMLATLEAMAAVFPPESILCHRVGDEDGEDDGSDDMDWDGGVGGEKEREQAEGGGVAREWEEEWRARVPAELEGKVGQWMPLGRFMEAQRRRMRRLRLESWGEAREQAEGGGVAREWEEEWRARVSAELEGKVGQWMPLGRFMEAQRRRMRVKATARLR